MTDKLMDMAPVVLPSCWVCNRRMKFGMIAGIPTNDHIYDRSEMHDDYRPVVWRYMHKDCAAESGGEDTLSSSLPLVYVAWIRLTIRLIDQKSAQFLFDITNWRYVLDCVQQDYIQGLNEYENPPLKRKKFVPVVAAEPEPIKTRPAPRKIRPLPRRQLARK